MDGQEFGPCALALFDPGSGTLETVQVHERVFNFANFCSRFAIVLARGSEDQIQWYAQQVYNLVQGGLADECCDATEFVDLYFDMAVTVLRNKWRTADELEDRMAIYRDLFMSAGNNAAVGQALVACASYHLQLAAYVAPKNDEEASHPFRGRSISHIAYELMGWIALCKRFHGALNLAPSHPMLMPAIVRPPASTGYSDRTLERLYANSKIQFGSSWPDLVVPSIDEMDG